MASTGIIEVGTRLPPVSKRVTQQKINLFEECGILELSNIHTDPEIAARRLGTSYPIASGRMSIAFVSQILTGFFGPDVYHHTGTLNLKFLRPVKDGDTISAMGQVTELQKEDAGTRVFVEVWCENGDGDRTAAGTASAVVAMK